MDRKTLKYHQCLRGATGKIFRPESGNWWPLCPSPLHPFRTTAPLWYLIITDVATIIGERWCSVISADSIIISWAGWGLQSSHLSLITSLSLSWFLVHEKDVLFVGLSFLNVSKMISGCLFFDIKLYVVYFGD